MAEGRVPDVFGLGCQRCATSWLHDVLNAHPEVGKPPKGVHFFSRQYGNGTQWYIDALRPHADRPVLGAKRLLLYLLVR
jgi:hypothetical protein